MTTPEKPKFNVVIAEGLEKTIKKEIVYNAFKKFNVKWLAYNGKVGVATIEFHTDAEAKIAMEAMNCKPILKRPIKMGIRSEKNAANALVEFSLSGLDQASDLNKVYRVTAKYGQSPKFGFNMNEKNKVFNRGYVSYLSIPNDEIPNLIKDLADVGVKCEPFDRKKPKKITVKVENFVEDFPKEDTNIQTRLTEATQILKSVISRLTSYAESKDYKILTRAPELKKEQPNNSIVAYVSFDEMEKACNLHRILRETKIPEFTYKGEPLVSFRVSETKEAYTNIFTTGLNKPAGQSDSQFRAEIEKAFSEAFEGVVQVNVTEKKKNPDAAVQASAEPEYMAFVTLKTEDNGKELIATYLDPTPKKIIQKFYKKDPYFNIFCSANFRKDFKKAQLGIKRIEKEIKTQNDNMKKEDIEAKNRRQFDYYTGPRGAARMMLPNGLPLSISPAGMPGLGGMNAMPGLGGMGMGLPMFSPAGMMPPGLPANTMVNPMMGAGFPGPMSANISLNPADMALKRKEFLKDKEAHLGKDINTLKRTVFHLIQFSVQEAGIPAGLSNNVTSQIVKVDDAKQLIELVENPDLVKEKVNALKKASP